MDFLKFINNYDFVGSIILLEGKRNVKLEDQPHLAALSEKLAKRSSKMRFRSGNAEGSDFLFFSAFNCTNQDRLQNIVPYSGHRKNSNLAPETFALNEIDLSMESDVLNYSRTNKKHKSIIDRYVSGKRDRFSLKAAYILRDTIKVIGTQSIRPATFAIFYDDLSNPVSGGTGHTIEMCRLYGIPFINQNIWMKWLVE